MNFSSFSNLNFYNFLNFPCNFNKEISLFLLSNYKKSQTLLFPLSQMSEEIDPIFIISQIFFIIEKELEQYSTKSYLFLEDIFLKDFLQKGSEDKSFLIKEKMIYILESPDILPSHKVLAIQNLRDELRNINRVSDSKEALFFYYSFMLLMKDKFKIARSDFTKLKSSYDSLLKLKDILGEISLVENIYDEWFFLLFKLERNLKEISLLSDENFMIALKGKLKEENFNINNLYLIPYNRYEDSFKISLRRISRKNDIVDIYEAYQRGLREWV